MPWKKFKVEGGWKNWKVDGQGNKIGDALSNKPMTEEDAEAQISALNTNEKKETDLLDSGEIVTDKESKDYYEAEEMPMMAMGPCSWDEMEAMEEAKELQDKMYSLTDKMSMMTNHVMRNPMIEDKAAAIVELANGLAERVKKPESDDKSNEAIAKQIAGDNQPQPKDEPARGLYIWKEGDTYRWLAAYSNNRRDEDNPPEIISSESHKEFDRALEKGEWPMPELWLWHVDYPVGITQYHAYDESTGFPVAAGIFYKDCNWAAEGIIQAGWDGNSHGMPNEWIQRDKNDKSIIVRHRTKEITFLPLWAAANKLAFNIISKESTMADNEEKGLPAHKRPEFIKAFGEERVAQIEAALENKSKEADAAGIEQKEAPTETTPETPLPALTPDSEIVKALGLVMENITAMREDFNTRIKALETNVTEVAEKQRADEPFDLMEFLKSKSAIGSPAAKIDGRSALAKSGPEETKTPPITIGADGRMQLSLIDQLVTANQQWAAGKQ